MDAETPLSPGRWTAPAGTWGSSHNITARPGLKVLLTSGYPYLVHGRASGFAMVAKPYQQADLAAKIAALFPAP